MPRSTCRHTSTKPHMPLLAPISAVFMVLTTFGLQAQTPPASATVATPPEATKAGTGIPAIAKPEAAKDVVLDRPASVVASPVIEALRPAEVPPPLPVVRTEAVLAQRASALSGSLAELGLSMLRARAEGQAVGAAPGNQVVSPVSLASALGLVHAGSTSAGAIELSGLLAPATASGTAFQRELPALLTRLNTGTPELALANRLWLDSKLAKNLVPTYVAAASQRYQASGALLSFAEPEAARKAINNWAAEHTGKRIQSLLPVGALTPTSKVVLTNALHFRAAWAKQFDAANTKNKPFQVSDSAVKQVPTLSQRMAVRSGVVDNATVFDLLFDEGRFSFTIAMPPKGHTLNAFEWDLSGQDFVAWSRHLPSVECLVELPKFKIEPTSVALKSWLQAMGVQTLFSERADFSPMLGETGKALSLDNVYQSAGIAVDENGAEASAATAAVMGVKAFRPQAVPVCKADRPFLFAITHVATGVPVFMGRVVSP